MRIALVTKTAVPTRVRRVKGDEIPHRQRLTASARCHPRAERHHPPCGLMAQNDRLAHTDRADPPLRMVMQIRAAEPDSRNCHQHLARAGRIWRRGLFQPQIILPVQPHDPHRFGGMGGHIRS